MFSPGYEENFERGLCRLDWLADDAGGVIGKGFDTD